MRTIDTERLKPLSPKKPGPWRLEDGRMLRVACGGHPIPTEGEAQEMLATYQACAASVGTPNAYEVVRVPGGYGVVVDYVIGLGMEVHIALGSYTPEELGLDMAKFLKRLHATNMDAGLDWNAFFRRCAAALAPLVPDGLGERLISLVEAVPRRHCLLHGDFHPGNMVLSNGVVTLIDMEHAGFGHPVFEFAVVRSRIASNVEVMAQNNETDAQKVQQSAHELWEALLGGYFEGISIHELEELNRRIKVLSALERCRFAYDIAHTGSKEVDERRLARAAFHAGRMAELLPQVERLDF